MKKIIALSLCASSSILFLASCGNNGAGESGGGKGNRDPGTLIVGSVTDLDANYLEGWTNSGQNASVRRLLYDCYPVAYTKEGTWEVNPTVTEELSAEEHEDGSKTFTVRLQKDLTFSDGSPITAKDYLFTLMLMSSPEYGSLDGANSSKGLDYEGYEEFHSGQTKTFSGLRLLDEYTYSVTPKAENFPYFFESTYAGQYPLPMSVLAPGVTMTDQGDGATLSEEFTEELLQKTINDSSAGYRYRPSVTCGPYRFVSFDPSTKQCILEADPQFKGSYDGVKPQIPRLVLKTVHSATELDELEAGRVDLLPEVSGGTSINAGLALADVGKAGFSSYARAGYGQITFACNHGPTQFQAVRQAIAYCLDRDEFARQYSGGYAKVVNSCYSMAQWEYKENWEKLEQELIHYSLDETKARNVLIEDGWIYNSSGGPFQEGKDTVRCKKLDDGTLMEGVIQWANTPNNPVSDLISTMLPSQMARIGLKLEATSMEFGKLQEELMQKSGQNYHMFNLASGFENLPSPWYDWNSNLERFGGLWNSPFIADEELNRICQEMKATPSGDWEAWSDKWMEMQKRWNVLLPQIPLYADEYHSFYTTKLKGFEPDGLWAWEYAIQRARLDGVGTVSGESNA